MITLKKSLSCLGLSLLWPFSIGWFLGGSYADVNLEIYVCHGGDVYVYGHAIGLRCTEWGDGR